jgi:hypothetical protein
MPVEITTLPATVNVCPAVIARISEAADPAYLAGTLGYPFALVRELGVVSRYPDVQTAVLRHTVGQTDVVFRGQAPVSDARQTALGFVLSHVDASGVPLVGFYNGGAYAASGGVWREIDKSDLDNLVGVWLGAARAHCRRSDVVRYLWRGVLPRLRGFVPGTWVYFRNTAVCAWTRQTRPRCASDWVTALPSYDYDASATCPAWRRFIETAVRPADVCLLQKWAGSLFLTNTPYRRVLSLEGPPDSGKSTIVQVLGALVGEGNHACVLQDQLKTRFADDVFRGARLVVVDEAVTAGFSVASATLLARAASGERFRVGRKHKSSRELTETVRVALSGPGLAGVSGVSPSLAKLLLSVRLIGRIDQRVAVPMLNAFARELPGIFNWACEGAQQLIEAGGFHTVDQLVHRFLKRETRDGAGVVLARLYERFVANAEGGADISMAEFGRQLSAAGLDVVVRRGSKFVKGISYVNGSEKGGVVQRGQPPVGFVLQEQTVAAT